MDRAQLRRWALAQREAIAPEVRRAWDEAIWEGVAGILASLPAVQPWIGGYWAVRAEPDVLTSLAAWAKERGAGVALPAAMQKAAPLVFRPWSPGASMARDVFGLPVPAGEETVWPKVLLVPLVAFDAAGYRIGYGGGFYDRTLAAYRAAGRPVTAIGVGYECTRLPDTRPGAHDLPMDWIVTEAGAFQPAARNRE
ncbi:MAG: 5-formyltetrahydrofolate cyclo-ligase [Rhodocyclales bacterium]|nr:5-formyltetrahydrofolate cyclo-ligase [Rhodocyclales bacterium]